MLDVVNIAVVSVPAPSTSTSASSKKVSPARGREHSINTAFTSEAVGSKSLPAVQVSCEPMTGLWMPMFFTLLG